MSNYCFNHLELRGNKSQRDEFMELIVDEENFNPHRYLSYRSMLQQIKEFSNKEVSDYLLNSNYDEKYIGFDSSFKKNTITFGTNWSPNKIELLYLSNFFPKVTFTLNYEESGMGFKGEYIFKNGKVLSDIVCIDENYNHTVKVFETKHNTLEGLVKEITSKYDYPTIKVKLFDKDCKNLIDISVSKECV